MSLGSTVGYLSSSLLKKEPLRGAADCDIIVRIQQNVMCTLHTAHGKELAYMARIPQKEASLLSDTPCITGLVSCSTTHQPVWLVIVKHHT